MATGSGGMAANDWMRVPVEDAHVASIGRQMLVSYSACDGGRKLTYNALTFDTNTVMANSYEFDGKLLAQLKQFKAGPVQVVVSDVIVREIKKHLTAKVKETRDAFENAHRDARRFGLLAATAKSDLPNVEAAEVASKKVDAFLNDIGAEVLDTTTVQLEAVMTRYFGGQPPFSDKKKNEFPDAIALLTLETWANSNKRKLLAVSKDGDWEKFAKASAQVDQTDDLAKALQGFQENIAAAQEVVKSVIEGMKLVLPNAKGKQFLEELQGELDSYGIDVEADSMYHAELQRLELVVDSCTFPDPDYTIVQLQEGLIVVEAAANVAAYASAEMSLSIYFSDDKDFMGAGDVTVEREASFDVILLLTIEGDKEWKQPQITAIEVLDVPSPIELGNIDGDMGGYEE